MTQESLPINLTKKTLAYTSIYKWGVLLFSYLMAWVNGFRMPNLWSLNYYLPSVMEGFYRRSMAGSLLLVLGEYRFNYYVIAGLQIIIFICLNIAIIFAWSKQKSNAIWLLPLFLVSPFGGYFFHEIGYIDQLLYLIFFIAISCSNIIFGLVLMATSLLFHEMALFTTIPLYVTYLLLQGRIKSAVTTVLVSMMLFGTIYIFFQTVERSQLASFIEMARNASNYPIRLDYFDIFSNQFMGARFQWYYSKQEMISILLVAPLWLMAGYVCMSKEGSKAKKFLSFLMGFICAFIPIVLGLFGWDCYRWIFLSAASSFCCFYLAKENVSTALVCLIALNMAIFSLLGSLGYFDSYAPRLGQLDEAIKFLQGGFVDLLTKIPQR